MLKPVAMHQKFMRRLCIGMVSIFLSSQINAATPPADPCLPQNVGAVIAKDLKIKWNEGHVRAWNEQGEFWSMPLTGTLNALSKSLETLKSSCNVFIADKGAYSARVTSKEAEKQNSMVRKDPSQIVSDQGTTLGVLSPGKGESLLIMYPARIAAAIALGKGTSQNAQFRETATLIPPELDIEYNFGEVQVVIFGGSGKLSMRKAAESVLREVRLQGYKPNAASEKAQAAFDGLFPPDKHESFWLKDDGILRVELEKLKNGRVKVNIHETKQVRK